VGNPARGTEGTGAGFFSHRQIFHENFVGCFPRTIFQGLKSQKGHYFSEGPKEDQKVSKVPL
jgi:hypothetical protein